MRQVLGSVGRMGHCRGPYAANPPQSLSPAIESGVPLLFLHSLTINVPWICTSFELLGSLALTVQPKP